MLFLMPNWQCQITEGKYEQFFLKVAVKIDVSATLMFHCFYQCLLFTDHEAEEKETLSFYG